MTRKHRNSDGTSSKTAPHLHPALEPDSSAAVPAGEKALIRLACLNCDRSDFDGISGAELADCLASGWTDIAFIQTYEQSTTAYDDPADAPAGHDVTEWYTHLGLCPDCRAETEACE
jgi:hypothetical protein